MVAIVTIMGIGGAFAMKAPAHQTSKTWGIVATVGNSYKVATLSSGTCDSDPTPNCHVISSATPNAQMLIPKAGATVDLSVPGNFVQ